jgi:hypothetical protein
MKKELLGMVNLAWMGLHVGIGYAIMIRFMDWIGLIPPVKKLHDWLERTMFMDEGSRHFRER